MTFAKLMVFPPGKLSIQPLPAEAAVAEPALGLLTLSTVAKVLSEGLVELPLLSTAVNEMLYIPSGSWVPLEDRPFQVAVILPASCDPKVCVFTIFPELSVTVIVMVCAPLGKLTVVLTGCPLTSAALPPGTKTWRPMSEVPEDI